MYQPQNSPQTYFTMLHQKRETELLLSALRLDLFSHLESWATAAEVAANIASNRNNRRRFSHHAR